MVILILNDDTPFPDVPMVHYNHPPALAKYEYQFTYAREPKFAFMRLSNPNRCSIVDDDYSPVSFLSHKLAEKSNLEEEDDD